MLRELLEDGNIIQIVSTFIAIGLVLAIILSIAFIIWGGLSFILSAGNEDKIKTAMNTIRYSIVGLAVTFFASFAVAIISRILGIPFDLNFSMILDLMNQIYQSLRG